MAAFGGSTARALLLATLVCAQLLKVGADEKEGPCGMRGFLAHAAETACKSHGGCCTGGSCHMFGCVHVNAQNLPAVRKKRFRVVKPKGHETSRQELAAINARKAAARAAAAARAKRRKQMMLALRHKLMGLLAGAKRDTTETVAALHTAQHRIEKQMNEVSAASRKEVHYTKWQFLSAASKLRAQLAVAAADQHRLALAKEDIMEHLAQLEA